MRDDGPKTTAVVRRHTTMPTIPMNYTRKNWALAPHTYFTQISVCVCERLARYAYEQPHSLEVWQHNTNNSACNCMCIGFCRVRYAPAGLLHSSTLHVCVCVCADKARGFAYVSVFCIVFHICSYVAVAFACPAFLMQRLFINALWSCMRTSTAWIVAIVNVKHSNTHSMHFSRMRLFFYSSQQEKPTKNHFHCLWRKKYMIFYSVTITCWWAPHDSFMRWNKQQLVSILP